MPSPFTTSRVASALSIVCMALVATACESAAPQCEAARLEPLPRAPIYAVVTSLFRQSSAIALLDETLTPITEAWLDSGSAGAGVTSALGGDVALPTTPSAGELVLIERIGVDTLTRIAVPSGDVLAQIPVQLTEPGTAAYRANPQDALRLDAHTFLVSRHEPNRDAKASEKNRGNDLVRIDADTGEIQERIALDALNTTVDGEIIYARPGRLLRVGDSVVVGLARLSRKFDVLGPGAVALFDLNTDAVTPVPLPGLGNCGEVRPLADDRARVVVLCAGQTFATAEGRRDAAGLVILHIADGVATVEHTFRAKDHPDTPPPQLGVVSLGGTRVAVASLLVDDDHTDALLSVDVATGDSEVVTTTALEHTDAQLGFDLGVGQFHANSRTLLIPSASQGILRFTAADDGALTATPVLDPSPCRRLPVRELGTLAP